VEHARDWLGVHSAAALLGGEPLIGHWYDRTRECAARNQGDAFLRFASEGSSSSRRSPAGLTCRPPPTADVSEPWLETSTPNRTSLISRSPANQSGGTSIGTSTDRAAVLDLDVLSRLRGPLPPSHADKSREISPLLPFHTLTNTAVYMYYTHIWR
jgi:hypothetical protein